MATLPGEGRYEVRVKPSFGDAAGPYRAGVRDAVVASLTVDEPVEGMLGADDGVWRFQGRAGTDGGVAAGSDAFDTFVELRAPTGGLLGGDDDRGPGTDSRLAAMLPDDGEYELRVRSAVGNPEGPYCLAVRGVVVAPLEGDTPVAGDLSVDSGGWRFRGEARRRVVVTAAGRRSSTRRSSCSRPGARDSRGRGRARAPTLDWWPSCRGRGSTRSG